MTRLRQVTQALFTGAVACGLLGIASAQQVESDALGTADAAANNAEGETADVAAGAQADATLNADSARGSLNNQAGTANPAATASQQAGADADADVNIPDRDIQNQADTQTGNDLDGTASSATQSSASAGQANSSQAATGTDTDAAADIENNSRSSQGSSRTDASAQAGMQNQTSTAGMTFRNDAEGIIVDRVGENSAAAQLGLQPGDQIVRFNGQWVNDPQQLERMLTGFNGSRPVDIAFRRDGRQFGRQIALDGSGQSQSAMRPNYDQGNYDQGNYGQGNYGQSNYGQSNYGQSNYGQSNYGQSNYGQSNYGQGNYGQGNYGQGNYGQGNQYGSPMSNGGCGQPHVTVACCDDDWRDCCRRRGRRHRRACRCR